MFGFIVSDGVSVLRAPLKPDRIVVHHVPNLRSRSIPRTLLVADNVWSTRSRQSSSRERSCAALTNADSTTNLTELAKLLPNHGK